MSANKFFFVFFLTDRSIGSSSSIDSLFVVDCDVVIFLFFVVFLNVLFF